MKRLRATVDIYVDFDLIHGCEEMTEEELEIEAKNEINSIIDGVNRLYFNSEAPVSMSETIQYEIYEEKE